jgi:CelD/BcsL family acetyltransferase involved in cellulose biosynthesis
MRALAPVELVPIPLGELGGAALAAAFDRAVDESDVDRFCSQHAFAAAAFEGLQPGRGDRIFRVVGPADGWLAFAERRAAMFGDPRPRRVWEPLEAMWGLCCPLLGADEQAIGAALAEVVTRAGNEVPVFLLCGLVPRSPRLFAAAAALRPTHRLIEGSETVRQIASLDGGLDGFLGRRSASGRGKLRRARRAALRHGLRYERHVPTDPDEARRLYARAIALDDASWKGRAEAGLRKSGLCAFYEHMLPRLAVHGALRVGFLVDGTEDVAYLFGGVRQGSFRGLQFAFRAGREAESLGNVIQLAEIECLCEEGVGRYDLGVEAAYKRHWGELEERTMTLIAIPRGPR